MKTKNNDVRNAEDQDLFNDVEDETAQKKVKTTVKDVSIERRELAKDERPTILVPKDMTLSEAAKWLGELAREEDRVMEFMHVFTGWYPLDAIWALYQAVAELHGYTKIGDYGFFPATSVSVQTGINTYQQIPWGPIQVRGVDGAFCPHVQEGEDGNPALMIHNTIKNKNKRQSDRIVEKTLEILRERSIYRGKAIEVEFADLGGQGHGSRLNHTKAPTFMDVDMKKDSLIFSEKVQRLLDVNLFTPIRGAQECRDNQIPLRRTVLLAGSYGVGKTMAARYTASECVKNGWTFIYLRDLSKLSNALYFAKKYQPAVVFAEDINRITDGARDSAMDELFNTVDGIDRKNDEVMIVFTTNNMEDIHPGMMRPGRVDSVITIDPPDAAAAEKLVRQYGRGLIDDEANLTKVGEMLSGQIPAIIREAVERSKLAAISDKEPGTKLVVKAHHLEIAATQCLEHAKLINRQPEEELTGLEVLGDSIGRVLVSGIREEFWGTIGHRTQTDDRRKVLLEGVSAILDEAGRGAKTVDTVD